MYKVYILFILSIISNNNLFSQVGIGTTSPNASSILDITSTSKGILIPRMTSSQRESISSPANGLMVYQTDGTSGYWYYNGSLWTTYTKNNIARITNWNITSSTGYFGIRLDSFKLVPN